MNGSDSRLAQRSGNHADLHLHHRRIDPQRRHQARLAGEIARIHSSINHVPSTYVDVAFHELSADSLYTDGEPARPALVSGWVRAAHRDAETTRLATEIATAVTRITAIPTERVLVVIQSSPARYAVEGGRVLPEPGHEQAGSPELTKTGNAFRRKTAIPDPRESVTNSTLQQLSA